MGQATSLGTAIAQLLNEGWRARTTVRNLGAAEEVRASIGKITANASAIESWRPISTQMLAGPMRSRGLTMCSMSRLPSLLWTRSLTMNWFDRPAMGPWCLRPRAMRA